jgi:hypothetical protein
LLWVFGVFEKEEMKNYGGHQPSISLQLAQDCLFQWKQVHFRGGMRHIM